MYQTKNDLPAQTRADVIGIRNARLADRIDLMHQAKQAHWHVKRPSFIALHKLFDDVVDAAEDAMDLLAKRVVQVSGTAEGTIQVATARTGPKAYTADAGGGASPCRGTRVRPGRLRHERPSGHRAGRRPR
jgi:starvation-inducible DNA-binding protein